MDIFIGQEHVEANLVSLREMGFGEVLDTDQVYWYRAIVGLENLGARFRGVYDGFVHENLEDDIATNYHDAYEELLLTGYANFDKTLESFPHILCELIRRVLFFEFFECFLRNDGEESVKYIINDIAGVRIDAGHLEVCGLALCVVPVQSVPSPGSPRELGPKEDE